MGERAVLLVEPAHSPVLGADPKDAGFILEEGNNLPAARRVGVAGFRQVGDESSGCAIELQQAIPGGSRPQVPEPVLYQCAYGMAGVQVTIGGGRQGKPGEPVALAIEDALSDLKVKVDRIPVSPEVLLNLIEDAKREMVRREG